MTFLALLFAHLLADYPLQGDFLAKMKGSNVLLMISHCGIWTGCICVAAHLCGLHINGCDVTILFAGHFLADEFKCRGWSLSFNPLGLPLWIDQIIHVGQILFLMACAA